MKRSTATLLEACEKRPKVGERPTTQTGAMIIIGLDLKKKRALTDVYGQPWDDVFFYCWKRGICCSQNADFLGFTQLISMRYDFVKHMDICHCKVQNTIPQWRSRNVGTFWFPIPGLCKKLWPTKTLFSGAANSGNFISAGRTYTCPGSPVKWVDYGRCQHPEAYKPLREDQVNSICPCYDYKGVLLQTTWEKDALLEIYNVENKDTEDYSLEDGDHVLYNDDGEIIGIWDKNEDFVLEARKVNKILF